ncbi:MAG: TonB-dependent receptor [Sphingomonas sp.]|uniref:TonB-dependent receptor domain-containing protein n=1 Tax=Sphingomonas sp. TaxID=28214 RepID=UPI001218C234|nr:TonB-dependent receptor [Sphingomonas sp.]THD35232.1 MAG: TonB-dependent receptor [Sphingomonas sp.]
MIKTQLLCACAASVLAIAATPAMAQTAPAAGDTTADSQDNGKDIVITGSIIRGTPEDAALPVNVIGAADLEKQGSPSAVELLKALPTSSGVLGDSNQFDSRSQGAEGIATANLRGLSPQRTLVLLNNRRLVTAGNGVPSVDINLIPSAAIGRIEVLKDGAAATYGSDAIAGVVNFITRTDQEGFRAAGSYKFVRGSDGDIDASLSYGHVGDNWRFLAAVSFAKRGELSVRDRPYLTKPYTENPQGGWTGGGNPATFLGIAASGAPTTALMADTSCAPLGGYVGANGRCYNQYTKFDNLADLEKRGTAFVDFEVDLSSSTKFEMTALYGRSTVPHYLTSPSYLLTQSPSIIALGGTNPTPFVTGFYVPASNPGFIAYRAANPTLFPATTTGAVFPLLLFRPYLAGGNPSTLGDPDEPGSARGMRKSESTRITAELSGKLGSDIDWSVSGTYHDYYRYIDGYDEYGDRVQLALRGLGGPNCNYLTGTPGVGGCMYLNPFGNAVVAGAVNGTTNPQGNAALANTAALANWIFVKGTTQVESQLFVADASISGSTGLKLPGGAIQFGVGAQYRYNKFSTVYGNNNNILTNPCRDSSITGNQNPAACAPTASPVGPPSAPNGAFGFLGTGRNSYQRGGNYAVYGELQLPVFDTLNVQLAARYEDYGGGVGSTFDPQIRARWQVTDWLAVRGGFGTTFRAPTLANITTGFVTSLQLIGSTFTPVDVNGNPSLKPEKSKNYSAGLLLKFGGFHASVDYFRYDLSSVIVSDPLAAMVATLFPAGAPNTCATNPTLADRFTFTTGAGHAGCSAATTVAQISRVNTFLQNGATQSNSGIDFSAEYRTSQFLGSNFRFGVGVDATYTIHNRISAISVAGVKVANPFDGVGLLNYQSTLYPLPKWKGQAFVDLGSGPVDARVTVYYTDGLHDQRFDTKSGPFAPDASLRNPDGTIPATPISLLTGADIKSFLTTDFNLQVKLPWNVVLTGTVINIFDTKAPFAREDYNYEPFIGNPFGREFKIGASVKF